MTAAAYQSYPNNYNNFTNAVKVFATSTCILGQCFRESDYIETNSKFDYVIVGGGTAGCVLANRLTEDPSVTVVVVEAGGNPPMESFVPGLQRMLYSSKYDWNYTIQNDKYGSQCLKSPDFSISRGKMLGGTSSLNALLWVRGSYQVYDDWYNSGNDGWDSETMIKYFKKSESAMDREVLNLPGGTHYRGNQGPIQVDRYTYNQYNDETFSNIYDEFGLNYSPDLNGKLGQQVGYGWYESTVYKGIRQSAAVSYLQPVQYRDNLFILKDSLVKKVIINQRKKSAEGVVVQTPYGIIDIYRKNKCGEIILSAGSINTPQLLQVSGIGPRSILKKNGIKVILDLPVGQNYQDHSESFLHIKVDDYDRPTTEKKEEYAQYFKHLGGPLAGNTFSSIIAEYSMEGNNYPQVQILHDIVAKNSSESCVGYKYNDELCLQVEAINKISDMFDFGIQLVQPKSKGIIAIQSRDATVTPKIYNNYGTHPDDLDLIGKVYQSFTNITLTPTLRRYNASVVHLKISHCSDHATGSQEYWACYHMCTATSPSHAVGSAKMGPANDNTTVVDNKLKIHGLKNIRVVDASIFPKVSTGNTYCPVVAVTERAADIIKDDRANCLSC